MKKNVMMRAASALLVAVLLTTCAISGTFAKYVTKDSSTDTARVAKWGVVVTSTSNAFEADYNKTESSLEGVYSVSADGTGTRDDVLAPGTNGTLVTSTITGTPEVAVDVTATADLTLTGWQIGETPTEYFPVVITVGSVAYKMGAAASDGATEKVFTTIAALEAAVEAALNIDHVKLAPNTSLETTYNRTVSWEWTFDPAAGAYQTDEKDTALGNLTTAPTITIAYTVTVTQVD